MRTDTHQDLIFRVIFCREPGDGWPDLVDGQVCYQIAEVAVTVVYEDGTLKARHPEALRGRRIKANGTLGGPLGKGGPHWYAGSYEIDEQGDTFCEHAIRAAQARLDALVTGLAAGYDIVVTTQLWLVVEHPDKSQTLRDRGPDNPETRAWMIEDHQRSAGGRTGTKRGLMRATTAQAHDAIEWLLDSPAAAPSGEPGGRQR